MSFGPQSILMLIVAPALAAATQNYHMARINGTVVGNDSSPYKRPPLPELDNAWNKLIDSM